MVYIQFGNTWWGEKWLNALIHTDYSNRLPRGKRYARNGSVENVVIEKGKVKAFVQGSRLRPYSVDISLKIFTQKEK